MFQKESLILVVALALLAAAVLPGQAFANGERITRGDVNAVFHAYVNGGFAIRQNNGTGNGAPNDIFGSHGAIKPFEGSPWDGSHHCVDDWHVLLVAFIDGGAKSEKNKDIFDRLDQEVVTLYLDGEILETERTSNKKFLNQNLLDAWNFEKAYAFQTGKIMSPIT